MCMYIKQYIHKSNWQEGTPVGWGGSGSSDSLSQKLYFTKIPEGDICGQINRLMALQNLTSVLLVLQKMLLYFFIFHSNSPKNCCSPCCSLGGDEASFPGGRMRLLCHRATRSICQQPWRPPCPVTWPNNSNAQHVTFYLF